MYTLKRGNLMMDMFKAASAANERLGLSVCKVLSAHGFSAQYAPDGKAALSAALVLIPAGASVGVPGCVTAREIGLLDELAKRGSKVCHHWDPELKPEDRNARLLDELNSAWIVMSANAIAADEGTIVNIDGTGNRVGAMSWAPGKLLIIAGINKIEPDLASALKRAHDRATPPNVLRIGGGAPCAELGRCVNCSSPKRVCRVTALLERPPFGREVHVIIVGEALGY